MEKNTDYNDRDEHSLQLVQFVIVSTIKTKDLPDLIAKFLQERDKLAQFQKENAQKNYEVLCSEKNWYESIWRMEDPQKNRIYPSQAFQFANTLMQDVKEIIDVEPCFDLVENKQESSGKQTKKIKAILRKINQELEAGEEVTNDIREPPGEIWNHQSIFLTSQHRETEGQDILIAHIDQGYQEHPEITHSFCKDDDGRIGRDFAVGNRDDRDGKADRTRNHGCATASVIVGKTIGVAPNAKILPLRTKKSGVVYLNWDPIIRALQYVNSRDDIDIVSMSLGGPFWSRAVKRQIKRATEKGVIFIAAAGNKVPFYIVFPANYHRVVSVAASTKINTPWIDSSRGLSVVTTAPGHEVHRALIATDHNDADCPVYYPSSGTSYATAHIAGVCALWLSRNKEILNKYDRAIRPLLFDSLLQKNALHTPLVSGGSWLFGGGIVNVTKLLDYDISADADELAKERAHESMAREVEISENQLALIEECERLKTAVNQCANANIGQNYLEELKLSVYYESEDAEAELKKLEEYVENEDAKNIDYYELSAGLKHDLKKGEPNTKGSAENDANDGDDANEPDTESSEEDKWKFKN